MCKNSDPVVLVKDTVLTSERNGTERMFWAAPITWSAFRDNTALAFEWQVLSRLNTDCATLIFAQTSADGKAWDDLPNASLVAPEIPGFLGGNISYTSAGTTARETVWIGGMLSTATFVRFGVQVSGDSVDAYCEIGLTLTVTPRVAGGAVYIAANYPITGVNATLLPVIDVRDANSVTLFCSSSDLATSATAVFEIYTAPFESGLFAPTGIQVTLDEAGETTLIAGGGRDVLSSYIQVQELAAGTATSGNAGIYVTVRPN